MASEGEGAVEVGEVRRSNWDRCHLDHNHLGPEAPGSEAAPGQGLDPGIEGQSVAVRAVAGID